MSAGGALQTAIATALGGVADLTGVFDGPPARAAYPYVAIDATTESDWGHKNGNGREVLVAITVWDDEQRRITRPIAGSVRVAVAGTEMSTGWTVEDKGIVQFPTAPAPGAAITAGYLFDVPVRFADDGIEVNRATFQAGEAPSVPLVEVRE